MELYFFIRGAEVGPDWAVSVVNKVVDRTGGAA